MDAKFLPSQQVPLKHPSFHELHGVELLFEKLVIAEINQ
jgi:hypothetical protein